MAVQEGVAPVAPVARVAAMLTHLDAQDRPRMVDVGAKPVTARTAEAEARVWLPAPVAALLRDGDLVTKKGSVFTVASLAGVMGAKRTADLIPLCHPLPLDDCQVRLAAGEPAEDGSVEVSITCRAATQGRTGVEMEALTGASVAALALYDMAKAASHGIVIREVRLLTKTGGKQDFHAAGWTGSSPAGGAA